MKLVYKSTRQEVKIGDRITLSNGDEVTVTFFREPHKSSSSGKVSVEQDAIRWTNEYYVGVIGAEWIEREDR